MTKDMENLMKGNPLCRNVQVIDRHPDGLPKLMFYEITMTGMSLRDSVLSLEQIDLDDGRSVFINKAADHPNFPVSTKAIRMDYSRVAHAFEDGDDTRYVEFGHMDMKGWFPARLMNMMLGTQMTEHMKDMCIKSKNYR